MRRTRPPSRPARTFTCDPLEARLVLAANIANPTPPAYGPIFSNGTDTVTISYESLIDLAGVTTDSSNPATLVVSLQSGNLTKNGNAVSVGDTLGPGESVVWNPTVRTPGVTNVMTVRARDGAATTADVITVNARIDAPDNGQIGPFDVTPGRRIDAAEGLLKNGVAGLSVTVANDVGDALLFQRDNEQTPWNRIDATDDSTFNWFPQVTSNVINWTDAKDSTNGFGYAAALTGAGLQLLTIQSLGGGTLTHTLRNLNTEIAGSPTLTGEIDTFKTINGTVYIVGRAASGDVVVFHQTGSGSAGNWAWTAENLYDELRANSLPTPTLVGKLVPYVTSWDGWNIAGLNGAGEIWSIWTAPGLGRWDAANLTSITNAPTLKGGLAVYLTSWGGINLAGLDTNNHVAVTWWIPSFGGDWRNADYNTLFSFGALRPETMTSYVTSWGALNIAGVDAAGKLHVFWWEPTRAGTANDVWTDSILNTSGTPFSVNSRIAALTMTDPLDTRISLFGTTADGIIQRVWWRQDFGGNWQTESL